LVIACGGQVTPGADAGPDAVVAERDGGDVPPCAADSECGDRLFCTGVERCMPGEPGTDARGCLPGPSPCTSDQVCDESADTCTGTTCTNADNDGFTTCQGDCDDTRNDINPGVMERCVPGDPTDEDCNPLTYGFLDRDMDGAGDAQCFNVGPDGVEHHGRDCDDDNSLVQDVRTCGLGACAGMQACVDGEWSACDGAAPATEELCDGIDGDCDGLSDADDSDVTGVGAACGASLGVCRPGTRQCLAGMLSCSGIEPTTETCNHLDDDCDGTNDDGVAAASCTRTVSASMAGNFDCFGRSCSTPLQLGGTSSTANTSPAAAFVRSWSGDLGYGSTFTARLTVRPIVNDSAVLGSVSLVLTPTPGAGPETASLAEGVPRVSGAAPGLFLTVYQGAVLLGYSLSGLPPDGAEATIVDALACGGWSRTATQTLTLSVQNLGPRFIATVSRTGCTTLTREYTFPLERTPALPGYRSDFYGVTSSFPRYSVGVAVDNDANLGVTLEEVSIRRTNFGALSDADNCVGCS
ncbi:MAG: hypothetical protein K8H88_04715, partial [Sandaracinaceae bacterium]|nr:hypothetical protein [Sandaracinaceae bacterium]